MSNEINETVTFKSRGVSATGELLLGSIEVQSAIQEIVNIYEGRIVELEQLVNALIEVAQGE